MKHKRHGFACSHTVVKIQGEKERTCGTTTTPLSCLGEERNKVLTQSACEGIVVIEAYDDIPVKSGIFVIPFLVPLEYPF